MKSRRWRERNLERDRQRSRDYYHAHREQRREAQRRYASEHSEAFRATKRQIATRNKALIDEAKNRPCADCGRSFPSYVMDLDHRDPSTKLESVSWMKSRAVPLVLAEIAKCDAVCANCHRERTHQRAIDGGERG